MPKLKLSLYQKNILTHIEKNGEAPFGVANLRSLLALQERGLIVSGEAYINVAGNAVKMMVWRLTEEGRNAIALESANEIVPF